MSDDNTPTLRLKPRARPDAPPAALPPESPAAVAAPAPVTAAPVNAVVETPSAAPAASTAASDAGSATLSLKLKPRASVGNSVTPSSPAAPAPVASTPTAAPAATPAPQATTSVAPPTIESPVAPAAARVPQAATATQPAKVSDPAQETPTGGFKLRPRPTSPSEAPPVVPPIATATSAIPPPLADTAVAAPSASLPTPTAATPAVIASLPPPPAATSAPAVQPAAPKVETQDAARFKLKPRLGPADSTAAAKPVSPALPAIPPSAPIAPPSLPAASAPVSALPPVAAASAALPPPLPAPTTALPPSGVPASQLPPLAPSKLPSSVRKPGASSSADDEHPENSRAFKMGLWIAAALVVLLVGAGGFIAFRSLMKGSPRGAPMFVTKPTPKPQPPVAVEEAPSTQAAVPEKPKQVVVDNPQSLPGRAIGKARDVVAARERSGQVSGVNEVLSDPAPSEEPVARPAPPVAKPVAKPAPVTPRAAVLTTPGDIAVNDEVAGPPPSAEFKAFVGRLRVNGVFQGEPGRALLNGRMVGVGEMADSQLGVRFTRIDPERKVLYFEDKAGSSMQRRY